MRQLAPCVALGRFHSFGTRGLMPDPSQCALGRLSETQGLLWVPAIRNIPSSISSVHQGPGRFLPHMSLITHSAEEQKISLA
jgi:hypothetical protein